MFDRVEHGTVDRLRITRRIDQHAASAVVVGDLSKALTQLFVEGSVEAFEPVAYLRSRGCPRKSDLDRQIEDHRQIGYERAESKSVQRGEIIERQSPAVALMASVESAKRSDTTQIPCAREGAIRRVT